MGAKMYDAPCRGSNGTKEEVTTAALANFFTKNAILLGRKGEHDKGSREKLRIRSSGKIQFGVTHPQLYIH
jgi:uncharacterized protein (UPF0262 family)